MSMVRLFYNLALLLARGCALAVSQLSVEAEVFGKIIVMYGVSPSPTYTPCV